MTAQRKFMKIDTNSKELARLDIRILCHLNELRHLRRIYKKMRHRSIHRLTALCRSRNRILVRIQEAAASEKQSRGPIVNILPAEILAEIFCLVEDTAYDSLEVQYSTPWVLGRVCHHWRIIVNSTPKLWANVSVEHADEREWTDGRLCLLREMLSRSRSYPLQVAYTASWDDYPYMLSELQPHAHHLSSLELATKCPHFLNPLAFYDFADTQLPLLESLTINVEGSVFGTYDHTTIRNEVTICPENTPESVLFRHAPRLTRVDIRGITLSHFPLPWSQIREFRGDVLMPDDLAVLRKAIHLQKAQLIRCLTPGEVEQSVYLPSLHHLTLYTDDYPCRHTELQCPNLKTLHFARLLPSANRSSNMCIGLDAFVAETQLHTLILDVGVHPFTTIHPIIQNCSSRLRVLSLDVDISMAADLYTQLIDTDESTCLAPHLEQLYIRDTTTQSFAESMMKVYPDDIPLVSAFMELVLVIMVASRVREGRCLRELVLCAPGRYQPSRETQEVLQNLRNLKTREGFKCTVHWGYHWTLLDHGKLF